MWDTRSTRICDTVSWFPTKVALPTNSSADIIATSLQDIVHVLANPTSRSPVNPLPHTHKAALQQLLDIMLVPLPDATSTKCSPVPSLRVQSAPELPATPKIHIIPESVVPNPLPPPSYHTPVQLLRVPPPPSMNASVDNPLLGVDLQTDNRTPLASTYDFETSLPGHQQRQLIRKSLRAITPAALNKRTIRTLCTSIVKHLQKPGGTTLAS